MKIYVQVKPASSKQEIMEFGEHRYLVYLKERAENNKANIELINLFAKFFCVPPSHIVIKAGKAGRNKILEVN